ncbi:Calcium-independent phospholipase A2-gamma like protein [Verticillium longisporum]|nr:Calcium-independent phospholipase A2-gamma like protein [Verticillium longisporum]
MPGPSHAPQGPSRGAGRPRSLRVLSLDGGGVKGYSTLLILKRIFEALTPEDGKSPEPKPCDVFDLIVGTSTGGLIAIMLGRLHMSMDECLREYEKTSAVVFGNPIAQNPIGKLFKKVSTGSFYDVALLEGAIRDLLVQRGKSADELFWEENPQCKVVVCVTRSITSKVDVIRNYTSRHPTQQNYQCAIWEAAAATAAAPMFFRSVTLKTGEEWVDGAMRRNNPINEAMNEVNRESERGWEGRAIGCTLSIGTGVAQVREVSNSASALVKSVVKIMTDSEDVADAFLSSSFGQQLERSHRYFRFNVPQGLQALKLDEWKETKRMNAFTMDYLSKYETGKSVVTCAKSLLDPDAAIPVVTRKLTLRGSPCVNFIDRAAYTNVLKDFFWTYVGDTSQIFVLWGLGGVGKTQLALKLADTMSQRVSVIWIRADQSNNFKLDYSKVLNRMLHDDDQPPKLETMTGAVLDDYLEQTRDYLEHHPGDWLLILDNADDMTAFRESMESYLPMRGRILVTTRDPRFQGDFGAPDDGMNVVPMDDEQSVKLLLKLIPARLQNGDEEESSRSRELVDLLGNLPLAIAQAAANIIDQQVSLSEYAAAFREATDKFEALKAATHDRRTRDPRNAVQSVALTWQISFERLEQSSPLSVTLLGYLACLHWDSVPRDMLRQFPEFAGLSDIEFRNVLARLIQLSLVEEYAVDDWPQLRMHPMTHEYAWKRTKENPAEFITGCFRLLGAIFPLVSGEDDNTWQLCSYLASHAIRVVGLAQSLALQSESQPGLMHVLALYLNAFGNVHVACQIASEALEMAKHFWPDQPSLLNSFRWTKIQCFTNAQRFEESLVDIDTWAETADLTLDAEADVAGSSKSVPRLSGQKRAALNQKYFALKELRRFDEAHLLSKQLEPPTEGTENEWTAMALITKHNSAHALHRGGRSREARIVVDEVLRNVRGPDGELRVNRREYLAFLNLKADLLLRGGDGTGDMNEGLALFKQVYDEQITTTGVVDSDTWIAANNVVNTLADTPDEFPDSAQTSARIFVEMLTACAAPGMKQLRNQDSGKFQRHVRVFLIHFDEFFRTGRVPAAESDGLLELRETLMNKFLLQTDVTVFVETFSVHNTRGVHLQQRGRAVEAEICHRDAMKGLVEWGAMGADSPPVPGINSVKDYEETVSTYHYNIMLAIARQGRLEHARAYREENKRSLEFAETFWGALEVRMQTDEMDRLVHTEAQKRLLDGDVPSDDPEGWWMQHDVHLSRSKMRYGVLKVSKAGENMVAVVDDNEINDASVEEERELDKQQQQLQQQQQQSGPDGGNG